MNPFFDILTVFLYIRCVFISYLLFISTDIKQNPGPKRNSSLSICHWNIGSIPTNNFFKLSLLQPFNSIYNFDLICISESFLDSSFPNDEHAL